MAARKKSAARKRPRVLAFEVESSSFLGRISLREDDEVVVSSESGRRRRETLKRGGKLRVHGKIQSMLMGLIDKSMMIGWLQRARPHSPDCSYILPIPIGFHYLNGHSRIVANRRHFELIGNLRIISL
ncbi:MAG: hypothetical protein ABSG46_13740 [Candidatus Binataceae bacterium]